VTRTFIALMIPSDWTDYLAAVSRDLAAKTQGLSWVRAENVHITLRFLGDLDDSGVQRVCELVARGIAGEQAPKARLGSIGAFPNLTRPRVVWVGLAEGSEAVAALARSVNGALERGGFGTPDKPFRPHLTLARVRERARFLEAIREAAPANAPPAAALDRVHVMKSELHPAGARYTALTEVRLRPPGGAGPPTPRPG
jgi:RNA 2',3'-cyclic 3'-phosphodiesterase